MRKYDPQDFAKWPSKYKLFATAKIAAHILTHNGEADLPEGEIVCIKYRLTAWNQLYRRFEPVYTVRGRDVYANVLADFTL
jgi:hypothetical protein